MYVMSAEDFDSDDEGVIPPLLSAPPPQSAAKPIPPTPATAPTAAPKKKAAPAPPAPPAPAPTMHKAGDVVRVDGLMSKPELNGREARVLRYDEAKGRYAVELAQGGTQLSLKPTNVVAASEYSSAPAPKVADGSGIKKGFLGGGSSASKKAAGGSSDGDGLTVVRKAEGADPLKLPEVQRSIDEQAAGASAARVGGGPPEWVTPDLLQKIAKVLHLRATSTSDTPPTPPTPPPPPPPPPPPLAGPAATQGLHRPQVRGRDGGAAAGPEEGDGDVRRRARDARCAISTDPFRAPARSAV
jgi:hypothetical protein